ncbi:hypothetical protein C8R45DRAFT_923870 [Mycena sanguinolenta]|nr:hypothetical protein C8R45DRAFT_923870 [Mycena sanguinolenta]
MDTDFLQRSLAIDGNHKTEGLRYEWIRQPCATVLRLFAAHHSYNEKVPNSSNSMIRHWNRYNVIQNYRQSQPRVTICQGVRASFCPAAISQANSSSFGSLPRADGIQRAFGNALPTVVRIDKITAQSIPLRIASEIPSAKSRYFSLSDSERMKCDDHHFPPIWKVTSGRLLIQKIPHKTANSCPKRYTVQREKKHPNALDIVGNVDTVRRSGVQNNLERRIPPDGYCAVRGYTWQKSTHRLRPEPHLGDVQRPSVYTTVCSWTPVQFDALKNVPVCADTATTTLERKTAILAAEKNILKRRMCLGGNSRKFEASSSEANSAVYRTKERPHKYNSVGNTIYLTQNEEGWEEKSGRSSAPASLGRPASTSGSSGSHLVSTPIGGTRIPMLPILVQVPTGCSIVPISHYMYLCLCLVSP